MLAVVPSLISRQYPSLIGRGLEELYNNQSALKKCVNVKVFEFFEFLMYFFCELVIKRSNFKAQIFAFFSSQPPLIFTLDFSGKKDVQSTYYIVFPSNLILSTAQISPRWRAKYLLLLLQFNLVCCLICMFGNVLRSECYVTVRYP